MHAANVFFFKFLFENLQLFHRVHDYNLQSLGECAIHHQTQPVVAATLQLSFSLKGYFHMWTRVHPPVNDTGIFHRQYFITSTVFYIFIVIVVNIIFPINLLFHFTKKNCVQISYKLRHQCLLWYYIKFTTSIIIIIVLNYVQIFRQISY